MKRHLRIAALLALSLAGTAHATSQVTATLSNFQLTTTGTVTPYLQSYWGTSGKEWGTLVATTRTQVGEAYVTDTGAYQWSVDDMQDNAVVIDATKGQSLATLASLPTSTTTSGSTTAHAQLTADLSLTASVSTGEGGGHAYALAVVSQSFWLAANSSITVTWDTLLTGSNSGEDYVLSYLNGASTAAGADAGGPAMQHYTIAHGDQKNAQGGFSFEKGDTSRTLTITTTDTGNVVNLRVEAFATTYDHVTLGPVPSVPEPETWAMALIGLALIGLKARRGAR